VYVCAITLTLTSSSWWRREYIIYGGEGRTSGWATAAAAAKV